MKPLTEKILLEIVEFGYEPEDKFYCLIDAAVSPDGLDVDSLTLSDPRNFDEQLKESGCLMMFTGDEIKELIKRGHVDQANLHESLVYFAISEGNIRKKIF